MLGLHLVDRYVINYVFFRRKSSIGRTDMKTDQLGKEHKDQIFQRIDEHRRGQLQCET
ncbi:hypothetical protein DAI22_08g231400 [Oryza sativa Japonica Group]|nr:hypothetical protein DAI22_08g231400 [Oryza sativa Japonica Group]